MTTHYSLKLPADVGARDDQVVMRILHDAVASHGVRRPAFSAPALSRPVDATDGHLTLDLEVLADDEDELHGRRRTAAPGPGSDR